MKFFSILLVGILISLLGFSQSQETPYVLLISFDGFRFDYAEKFDAENFKSLMESGAHAEGLIPSFPSKTFPNHYSIVTGLYPGTHGLVDNFFYDPGRREFYEMKNRDRVTDPYYYRGTPLWKLAHDQGMKSASLFWVGSELPQAGMHPDYYYHYDESLPDSMRVQQIFQWLKLPADKRPHFITLYFSSPDHEGHLYGPSSDKTREAVLNADRNLGIILKGIRKINLPVNIVIVSDHGMEELQMIPETYIFISELINRNDTTIKVANSGTHAHIYVKNDGQRDSLYNILKENEKNYSVYRQSDFPKHWHYNTARSGDLLITANAGHYIVAQDRQQYLENLRTGARFGTHGYDPAAVKNMRGIFYAVGPSIRAGIKIAPFSNIHIYPLIARILGLNAPPVEGDIKVLEEILVR